MRLCIQRVTQASVSVDGQVMGAIDQGLVALLGVSQSDTDSTVPKAVDKLLGLRCFADESGRMNLSVSDIGGGILLVSQFTLYGEVKKGKRPSFSEAAPPERAKPLYDSFLAKLRHNYHGVIETGQFGAMMQVHLINDGPVTFLCDI